MNGSFMAQLNKRRMTDNLFKTQVGKFFGVDSRTIDRWIQSGKLESTGIEDVKVLLRSFLIKEIVMDDKIYGKTPKKLFKY